MSEDVPTGFAPLTRTSPLLEPWLPVYMREDANRIVLGLRLREAHCNSRGTAHGGLIAALADQAMGMSCGVKLSIERIPASNLWTTSLGIDYLGAAKSGQWLEFATVFTHASRTLCNAEIDVSADGATIARGRAVFRIALDKR